MECSGGWWGILFEKVCDRTTCQIRKKKIFSPFRCSALPLPNCPAYCLFSNWVTFVLYTHAGCRYGLATGKTDRFTVIERWRNNERILALYEHPLQGDSSFICAPLYYSPIFSSFFLRWLVVSLFTPIRRILWPVWYSSEWWTKMSQNPRSLFCFKRTFNQPGVTYSLAQPTRWTRRTETESGQGTTICSVPSLGMDLGYWDPGFARPWNHSVDRESNN